MTSRESFTTDHFVNLPRNYLGGCVTSLDTDTDHDVLIKVGQARNTGDSTNILLSTEITKRIDATWAVGDNNGGLNATDFDGDSSGVAPDTWYHVHLIKDASGIVDAGFDKSVTATNLLSDSSYISYRRVGSIMSNSTAAPNANILAYTQVGNHFTMNVPQISVNTNPAENTLITETLTGCPIDYSVLADIGFSGADTDTTDHFVYIHALTNADEEPSSTSAPLSTIHIPPDGIQSESVRMFIRTNTSAQIGFRTLDATAGTATLQQANFMVYGWIDDRGKDGD
jgi:hypothetical protein